MLLKLEREWRQAAALLASNGSKAAE
jgi:hypothetical protein